MLQILLDKQHYTGVLSEEPFKLQSFYFMKVLRLMLLMCMDIRFVSSYHIIQKQNSNINK